MKSTNVGKEALCCISWSIKTSFVLDFLISVVLVELCKISDYVVIHFLILNKYSLPYVLFISMYPDFFFKKNSHIA
jgi:hypothetical protein